MADLFAWLFSFFILIALIVLIIYQLMCLADLEFDYINPYDSSSRINKVVLPEYITLGVLCCFYLVTGHWIMSLFCAPYLYYNVRLVAAGCRLQAAAPLECLRPRKHRHLKIIVIFVLDTYSCTDKESIWLMLQRYSTCSLGKRSNGFSNSSI